MDVDTLSATLTDHLSGALTHYEIATKRGDELSRKEYWGRVWAYATALEYITGEAAIHIIKWERGRTLTQV